MPPKSPNSPQDNKPNLKHIYKGKPLTDEEKQKLYSGRPFLSFNSEKVYESAIKSRGGPEKSPEIPKKHFVDILVRNLSRVGIEITPQLLDRINTAYKSILSAFFNKRGMNIFDLTDYNTNTPAGKVQKIEPKHISLLTPQQKNELISRIKFFNRFLFTYLLRTYAYHNKNKPTAFTSMFGSRTPGPDQAYKLSSSEQVDFTSIKLLAMHELFPLFVSSYNQKHDMPTTQEEIESVIDTLDFIKDFVEKNRDFVTTKNISSILNSQGLPQTQEELEIFEKSLVELIRFARNNDIKFESISSISSVQGLPKTEEELVAFKKVLVELIRFARDNGIKFESVSSILHQQGLPKTEEELKVLIDSLKELIEFARSNGIKFKNISSILNTQGLPKTEKELNALKEGLNFLLELTNKYGVKFSNLSSILNKKGVPNSKEEKEHLEDFVQKAVEFAKQNNINVDSIFSIFSEKVVPDYINNPFSQLAFLKHEADKLGIKFSNISNILSTQGIPQDMEEFIDKIHELKKESDSLGIEFSTVATILSGQGAPKDTEKAKEILLQLYILTEILTNISIKKVSRFIGHRKIGLTPKSIDELAKKYKIDKSIIEKSKELAQRMLTRNS